MIGKPWIAFCLGWCFLMRLPAASNGSTAPATNTRRTESDPGLCPLIANGQPQAFVAIQENAGELTRRAEEELQKYVEELSGAMLPIWTGAVTQLPQQPALIAIGTAANNPLIADMVLSGAVATNDLQAEGYALKTLSWKGQPAVVVAGADDAGALYGTYELLEQLGIVFRLTGDVVPEQRPDLVVPRLDIKKSPAFRRRGFLFAANFANASMFSWRDYQKFLDQMARMKCNYLQFWWFAFSPWLQYTYRGETNWCGDVSTRESGYHNPRFGGFGSRTVEDVTIGREHFQAHPRLAPLELQHVETSAQAQTVCRDLLRRIIAYAAERNIKVWPVVELGSLPPNLARYGEIVGDAPFNYLFGTFLHPLDPVNREIQVRRLKALSETYPQAEGFFLNFPELYPDLAKPKYARFFRQQRPQFEQLRPLALPWSSALANFYSVGIDRAVDSTIGYFDLFKYLLKARDQFLPGTRLGLMTVGRGYALPLLAKRLPLDIPFAALESGGVWTREGIPMRYFGGMGSRERILQPRIDGDFDMLGMQFSVGQYVRMDRIFIDGVKQGLTGMVGQVERVRGTEFNSSFVARASWEPHLTSEQFYADSAKRIFGEAAAPEMEKAFQKLEENQADLAYYEYDGGYGIIPCCGAIREVNSAYAYWRQPNIYAGPTASAWKLRIDNATDSSVHHERAISLLNEALAHLRAAAPAVAPQGRYELNYLINRTEVYRDVFAAMTDFRQGMVQFDDAFAHRSEVKREVFLAQLDASVDTLRRSRAQLENATREYSRLIDHVCDLAVLYSLNARVLLGTRLTVSLLEDVVNYHGGQPYLIHVPFEQLYPRRPDEGTQD